MNTEHPPLSGIQNVTLFENCRPEFLAKLRTSMRSHNFSKGHFVFMQDDLAEWFYVVQSGWVKLFRQTLDGEEVILDVLNAHTLFGETELFDKKTYRCSAEIVQDAVINAYPLALLREEISENPTFAVNMLQHTVHGQNEKDKEIEHRTIQNAPQRLGCFLLRLIPAKRSDVITLNLPYDKTLIASRLGMKPETFSRALARLKDDLGLKIKGSTIEITSMDSLISYTCSACSNAYPCNE